MQILYPTKPSFVTQPYGVKKAWYKPYHKGVDFRTRNHSLEIRAVMNGEVILVTKDTEDWFFWNGKKWSRTKWYGTGGSYGNHIIIDHGGFYSLYAHCSKLFVKKGDEVRMGQTIAHGGNTGHSQGTHLHFELRIGGNSRDYCVNPLPYMSHSPNNPDLPSDWARKDWEEATELGITNGKRPHDNVTREENIVMLMRLYHKLSKSA